jgi:hypothetical protein
LPDKQKPGGGGGLALDRKEKERSLRRIKRYKQDNNKAELKFVE